MAVADIAGLLKAETAILRARLDAVRASITHAGEKGHSLEREAQALFRAMLPGEYGVGTGFVVGDVDGEQQLSPQLDVIIFDAFRGGPIIDLGSCQVYPIEAVLGYAEVKASLYSELADVYKKNNIVRRFTKRRLLRHLVAEGKSLVTAEPFTADYPSIRSYLFGFEYGKPIDATKIKERLEDVFVAPHSHFHAIAAPGQFLAYNLAVDNPTDPGFGKARVWDQLDALGGFKYLVKTSLAQFPGLPAGTTYDHSQYLLHEVPKAVSDDQVK